MESQWLARIISIVFGPHVWLPFLLIVTLLKSGLSSNQLIVLFPLQFLFLVFIPFTYLYLAVRFEKVKAWDLPKREERFLFLGISVICDVISILLIYIFGNKFLVSLSLIILILLIVIAVITLKYKISLHSSLNTAGSIWINFLFGWSLPILYLLIPITFWSRLTLRRHNIRQLVAGTFISGFVTLTGLRIFGYI